MEDVAMKIENIAVDGYQRVMHVTHDASGLDAVIAIHNTKLGPAIGGIRFYEYNSFDDQLNDALRLSKGMTFKNAAAGLDHGGAKTTVNASKIKNRETAFQIIGKAVNLLDGAYICAGDIGTTTQDLYKVNDGTHYVAGIKLDSSLPTALGVYTSIETLLHRNKQQIDCTSFTLQGMGKVGFKLANMLIETGGTVSAYDPYTDVFEFYDNSPLQIEQISKHEVVTNDTDVFVPCALGAVLDFKSLNTMTMRYVCGSANNQFATNEDVGTAHNLGYQYVPDFIANCGGVVAVALDFYKQDYNRALTVDLANRIKEILDEAAHTDRPAQIVAEEYANRRLK